MLKYLSPKVSMMINTLIKFTYFFSSSSESSLVTTYVVFGDKTLFDFFAAINFFINGSINIASCSGELSKSLTSFNSVTRVFVYPPNFLMFKSDSDINICTSSIVELIYKKP